MANNKVYVVRVKNARVDKDGRFNGESVKLDGQLVDVDNLSKSEKEFINRGFQAFSGRKPLRESRGGILANWFRVLSAFLAERRARPSSAPQAMTSTETFNNVV